MLSKKQKKFYEKLQHLIDHLGYFPTVREIGRHMSLSSPATVQAYLAKLAAKGYLRKKGHAWELIAIGRPTVPLVGIVPAGSPLEVFEAMGDEVDLPDWMVDKEGEIVAFRVQGDSMKDAFIQEGDIVIIKPTPMAETGEMVVALLPDSSITLKRFKKEGEQFSLIPENPSYQPIHDPFQIIGRVIGVLRRYR